MIFASLVVLALLVIASEARSRRALSRFGLAGGWGRSLRDLLALLALALLAGAPVIEDRSTTLSESPAISLAIDVSKSMGAADTLPTRLDRAKIEARELVEGMPGARFSLVPFAGDAVLQVPLTQDRAALLYFLENLEPGCVSAPGSAPEEAVKAAAESLAGGSGEKVVVLFSDGERTLPAPPPVLSPGIPVFVVPLGSPDGASLLQVAKTSQGTTILTRLDGAALAAVAARTEGDVLSLSSGRSAIAPLVARFGGDTVERANGGGLLWLAFLLLLLRQIVSCGGRRVLPLSIVMLILSLHGCERGDDRGRRLFGEASSLAAREENRAALERFGEAIPLLEGDLRGAALHNRGTLLLKEGDAAGALRSLEEAILHLPGDDAVRTNLVLALRAAESTPPYGVSESDMGEGEEESPSPVSREEALRLLESVRPDPASEIVSEANVTEIVVERDW